MKLKLLYLSWLVFEWSTSSVLKCFDAGPDDSNGETRVLCIFIFLKICDSFSGF